MPKTVLIILAAVVALIVIVVLTGMRYLRAEDDDDFDDDAPAEHGHVRSRGTHPTREQQARPRPRHDGEMPDEPRRERVGAARPGASYSGERGPDRRGATRGQDRGWRDDGGEMARGGEMPRSDRELAPQRHQRAVRAGRGGHADISEPIAASARSGHSRPGRGASRRAEEFDSQPGRVTAATRVYERETAGGRERRDDMDRLAGHDEADFAGRGETLDHRDDRDSRDSRDSRGSRDSRDERDRMQARPAASVREIGDHDDRDRRDATRPNARPDSRKNGARSERGELLPAVKPRQGKSKRDSDGDWPTNEWDELSDVDYWAELASDKPLTTSVPSGQGSRAQSRESRQDARPDPDRHERADASAGSELAVRQPNRRERQPGQALLPAAARKPDLAASARIAASDRPETADRSAAPGRPAAARPGAAGPGVAGPAPADDDPLTSPSFPRIEADDSRSYRRTRAASDARQPASREPVALQATRNGGRRPAAQAESHTAYPAVPRVESVSGLEGASRGYPRSGAGGSDFEATTAGYPNSAADRSSPGYGPAVPASYQMPDASVAGYEPATGGYSMPTASLSADAIGGYPVPAEPPHSAPVSGYHAPISYPPGGASAAGYLPPMPGNSAGTGGYGGQDAPASYPSSDLPGYRTEAGAGAYRAALPGYPPDSISASYPGTGYPGAGYPGSGSYSPPAPTSGYDSGYQDPAGGYQGYPGSGSYSGAHLPPEPGYQAGAYPGSAEPSFGGSLPGGYGDLGYPAYPAPAPQPPGYQDAAHQAGRYDPAGYPAPVHETPVHETPVHETDGYAGADPYAVDPYGQPGYGGTGY